MIEKDNEMTATHYLLNSTSLSTSLLLIKKQERKKAHILYIFDVLAKKNPSQAFEEWSQYVSILEKGGTGERRSFSARDMWFYEQRNFNKNRTGRDIVIKSRQIGMTTLESARNVFFALCNPGTTTLVVSHVDSVSSLLLLGMMDMYDSFAEECESCGLTYRFPRINSPLSSLLYHQQKKREMEEASSTSNIHLKEMRKKNPLLFARWEKNAYKTSFAPPTKRNLTASPEVGKETKGVKGKTGGVSQMISADNAMLSLLLENGNNNQQDYQKEKKATSPSSGNAVKATKASNRAMWFSNGSRILVKTAGHSPVGAASIRGFSAQRAHLTEIGYWAYPDISYEAIYPLIKNAKEIVIESTPAGPNYFYTIAMKNLPSDTPPIPPEVGGEGEGEDNEKGNKKEYRVHFWPFWKHDAYATSHSSLSTVALSQPTEKGNPSPEDTSPVHLQDETEKKIAREISRTEEGVTDSSLFSDIQKTIRGAVLFYRETMKNFSSSQRFLKEYPISLETAFAQSSSSLFSVEELKEIMERTYNTSIPYGDNTLEGDRTGQMVARTVTDIIMNGVCSSATDKDNLVLEINWPAFLNQERAERETFPARGKLSWILAGKRLKASTHHGRGNNNHGQVETVGEEAVVFATGDSSNNSQQSTLLMGFGGGNGNPSSTAGNSHSLLMNSRGGGNREEEKGQWKETAHFSSNRGGKYSPSSSTGGGEGGGGNSLGSMNTWRSLYIGIDASYGLGKDSTAAVGISDTGEQLFILSSRTATMKNFGDMLLALICMIPTTLAGQGSMATDRWHVNVVIENAAGGPAILEVLTSGLSNIHSLSNSLVGKGRTPQRLSYSFYSPGRRWADAAMPMFRTTSLSKPNLIRTIKTDRNISVGSCRTFLPSFVKEAETIVVTDSSSTNGGQSTQKIMASGKGGAGGNRDDIFMASAFAWCYAAEEMDCRGL